MLCGRPPIKRDKLREIKEAPSKLVAKSKISSWYFKEKTKVAPPAIVELAKKTAYLNGPDVLTRNG